MHLMALESHIVDQIQAGYTGEEISSVDFYQSLQNVIQEMDSIKKEAMEIKEKTIVQHHLHKNLISTSSVSSSSSTKNIMVGFDDMLLEIMDKLTGQRSSRQVIPIVGMGGIGKTTLARIIYINRLVKQHFDICGWATISQQYDAREILTELLRQGDGEGRGDSSEDELGVRLHKYLSGRRYLIVLDDMWSSEAWYAVNNFFPDNNNGSRIVVTTRLSSLASQFTSSYVCVMRFLNENESWNLLCQTVFGEGVCPPELEETGKNIARSCKGLPLSAVVIGGFLKKSERVQEYWENIARNLNSIVTSEDSGLCLKILQMSYDQLPVYLKPCFLYMGVFPEDREIRVSELIKLWVAEGFLKPVSGKDAEEVALGYFKDLVDRNLILGTLGSLGKVKSCNIHDLLRDFCLREAKKGKFLYVAGEHSLDDPHDINTQRRIAHHRKEEVSDALRSTSVARSLLCDSRCTLWSRRFRLSRIWRAVDEHSYIDGLSLEDVFRHLNSRYIKLTTGRDSTFPSSIHLLWNLHTLTVMNSGLMDKTAPPEIWKMPQLRHVKFAMLCLPDPPGDQIDEQDGYVLGNLRTLSKIRNFKCGEEVIKRIPNIRKLRIMYDEELEGSSPYSLNNLERLNKLESFHCDVSELHKPSAKVILQNITFPNSIKKLSLLGSYAGSEDMLERIGSLPLLEKLRLISISFDGDEWETAEGQFCSLKFLLIQMSDLKHWYTDSSHFPCLEHLVLNHLDELEEIPSSVGDIPTLESIELNGCSDSTLNSAVRVLEEQEELGNDGLIIKGTHWMTDLNEEPDSVASPNFQVEIR